MTVNYNKSWKLLVDKKNMNKIGLRVEEDIGTATLAKLSKNRLVGMELMMKIETTLKQPSKKYTHSTILSMCWPLNLMRNRL